MTDWKKIPNYSRYSISKSGAVRNDSTGKLLARNLNSTGYKRVLLYSDPARKYKQCLLHRLLAATFIPNPKDLGYIDHVDGNKLNNQLQNLQWVEFSENVKRAYALGLNANMKLSLATRKSIASTMDKAVRGTAARLARQYNVDHSRILQIAKLGH